MAFLAQTFFWTFEKQPLAYLAREAEQSRVTNDTFFKIALYISKSTPTLY